MHYKRTDFGIHRGHPSHHAHNCSHSASTFYLHYLYLKPLWDLFT